MYKLCFILIVVVILTISACATVTNDIHVEARTDPMISLNNYKTYAWLDSAKIVYDPQGKWEPQRLDIDAQLKFLINQQLRELNLIQVRTEPDLYITFSLGLEIENLGIKKNPDSDLDILESAPKGALYVILIDAVTNYPAWIGKALGDVKRHPPSMEEAEKRLDFAVYRMFTLYPIVN